jgi:IS30 family transposase
MRYNQITPAERYTFGLLRRQGFSDAEIARVTGRHRSTIGREFVRNCSRYDGAYRPTVAQEKANNRRFNSSRNRRFGEQEWSLVEMLLREKHSPEQIAGRLRSEGILDISHETIYVHIWREKRRGGQLWRHLRQPFKRRKRYGSYEKRGRVVGKRHISERPPSVEQRREVGHWEMDTVLGAGNTHCVVSLVERVTGTVLIGKLIRRDVAALNERVIELIRSTRAAFKTITADNGTEFHGYREIEHATGVPIYFATPYHSWERGTNENTNGLIRQYLPKRTSMKHITQEQCTAVAGALNLRPRKRHAFRTPIEMLEQHFSIAW